MNKHIKMLTDIAVTLAIVLVLTVALLPTAAAEPDSEPAEESSSSDSQPQDEPTSETTSEPVKTSGTTTPKTTAATTTTAASTTTAPPTTQTAAAPTPSWTEQPVSGVMYVNTDGISSVEVAQIGSKKMKQYSLNDAVTVVAVTDTDYYKLEDGTFIHSDFLSTSEIVITAGEETQPPVSETEEPEDAGQPEETDETASSEETSDEDTAASE